MSQPLSAALKRRYCRKEMLRLEVDAPTARSFQKDGLHIGRDKAVSPAARLGIRPAADPTFVSVGHVCYGFYAATDRDYGVCWFHHVTKRAQIARFSQGPNVRFSPLFGAAKAQ